MQLKKNPKFDLERKKTIFFSIGLILSLSISLYALEYKTVKSTYTSNDHFLDINIEEEFIPPTVIKKKLKKPVIIPDKIEVEKDNIKELEEVIFESTESWEDEILDLEEITSEPEEIETVDFAFVESLPKFKKHRDITDRNLLKSLFMKEIMLHVKRNFRYPEIAKEQGIQGRVICQFTIDENGFITDAIVARGVDRNLDNEALRIINKIPQLLPASQRYKAVKVSFVLPITFKLAN